MGYNRTKRWRATAGKALVSVGRRVMHPSFETWRRYSGGALIADVRSTEEMSAARTFIQELGAKTVNALGDGFQFHKSRLEMRRKSYGGNDIIIFGGSNKWSPLISISLYFGRNFDEARRMEKLAGDYPMPYHIQQYSPNVRLMINLGYEGASTWEVDITAPRPALAGEIAAAIRGFAYPFFQRFADIKTARDALACGDSWCFSPCGPGWHALLKIDAALGDLRHFDEWRTCMEDFYFKQSTEGLRKYKKALGMEI